MFQSILMLLIFLKINIMQRMDINKFSIAQMCSNKDGKTSGSGTVGIYICLFGVIGFMFGVGDFMWGTKKNDVMIYSTGIITIGAGLLGFRKSQEKMIVDPAPKIDNTDEPII